MAASLAGCSLGGGIARHSAAYNTTVEQATNTVLVTNILRARDRAPLHFSAIGAIHGALSLSAGLGYDLSDVSGLPSALPALFASTNPSFDIGPLDRQEFARGLIRPIDPGLFRLLSERRVPDQFLVHLLVSRFEDTLSGQVVHNDPRAPRPQPGGAPGLRRARRRRPAALRPLPGDSGRHAGGGTAVLQRLHPPDPRRAEPARGEAFRPGEAPRAPGAGHDAAA
jgi:hypothetical protein